MNILALDASTHNTGWSIFNNKELKEYGYFSASSIDLIKRIYKMITELNDLLLKNQINIIVLEEVRPELGKNMQTYKALMYLQAAIIFLVHEHFSSIKVEFINPSEWRKICGIQTGRGIKRKELKQADINFVKEIYDIDVNDDEADAIGIGYAYVSKIEWDWE